SRHSDLACSSVRVRSPGKTVRSQATAPSVSSVGTETIPTLLTGHHPWSSPHPTDRCQGKISFSGAPRPSKPPGRATPEQDKDGTWNRPFAPEPRDAATQQPGC